MPFPVIPIIVAGATAGILALVARKKKTTAAAPLEPDETPVTPQPADPLLQSYQQAMDPGATDIQFLTRVRDALRNAGRNDLAANVSSKIASLQAASGAQSAAWSQARRDWEAGGGDPLQQSDADRVVQGFQSGQLDGHPQQAQLMWNLLMAYGFQVQAQLIKPKLDAILAGEPASSAPDGAPAATDGAPPSDAVIVDEGAGEEVVPDVPGPDEGPPTMPDQDYPAGPEDELPPPPAGAEPEPENPPPLAGEEVQEQNDPNGTIALAKTLINLEHQKDWKQAGQSLVENWQREVGLGADGKFGPKSALRMADEVGTLPWIRFFPSGSPNKTTAVRKYRDQLLVKAQQIRAAGNPEHAIALEQSAQNETGQGWPSKPAPTSPVDRTNQAQVLQALIDAYNDTVSQAS